jgi:hypothetical protein
MQVFIGDSVIGPSLGSRRKQCAAALQQDEGTLLKSVVVMSVHGMHIGKHKAECLSLMVCTASCSQYMSPSGTYAVRGSMGGTPGTAGVAAIPGQYTAIQGGPPAVPLPPGAIPPQQQHFNNPQPLSPRNGLGPTAAAAMNGPGSQYSHLSQVNEV